MIVTPLDIVGAFLLTPEDKADRRGFFTRAWARHTLEERGLDPVIVRCDVVLSPRVGTVRGLYVAPHEHRLLRCTRGAVHAVLADTRHPSTPTVLTRQLDATAREALYVPPGVAHGFQTLDDEAEAFFQMSELETEDEQPGIRWDDPTLAIDWPLPVRGLSPHDRAFPTLDG